MKSFFKSIGNFVANIPVYVNWLLTSRTLAFNAFTALASVLTIIGQSGLTTSFPSAAPILLTVTAIINIGLRLTTTGPVGAPKVPDQLQG